MKKTTNSNPLKFFNDAAAARSKSVIAGNNKLMKAQDGKSGNIESDSIASENIVLDKKIKDLLLKNESMNQITNKNKISDSKPFIKKNIDPGFYKDAPNNYKNIDPGFNIPIPKNYKNPDPGFYKGPENMQKKGGIVKSKKK